MAEKDDDALRESLFPAWLEERLISDRRFASAYETLGPRRRSLLKTLIARHFALHQPGLAVAEQCRRELSLFTHTRQCAPAPFALIVLAPGCDAPALLLAALVPALCARVPQVLVVRLGQARDVSDAMLCACELAGQERLAALGPKLLARLLLDLAAGGRPGLLLHPDTAALRSVFQSRDVEEALAASPLRRMALRMPLRPGIWRDAASDFPADDLALLYGDMPLEQAGQDGADWQSFVDVRRDLLLVPPSRSAEVSRMAGAQLVVDASCLGLWRWREISDATFVDERQSFGPVPGAPTNQS